MSLSDNTSLLGKHWQVKNTSAAPLIEKLLENRGIMEPAAREHFFHAEKYEFHDPFLMKGMERAVERIHKAIKKNERIIVYGDYDVDGITGTAILVHTLTRLGAIVSYRIPHRFNDGYGLHDIYVDECVRLGATIIITVDCGISCAPQITRAARGGIDVIVTDHHTIPAQLPLDAYAILHPLQPDCGYPCKGLTGSAVAFKLAHGLLMGAPQKTPQKTPYADFLESLTDLAAMGVVADMGPLLDENRTIVKRGLHALKNTRWKGLARLKEIAGVDDNDITTQTIGFRIGPRINAAGRIEHPYFALQLLLQTDDAKIEALANKLEELNRQRQTMTKTAIEQAMAQYDARVHTHLFIAVAPDFHTGILGLIAAKAVELFGVPAIIVQDRPDHLVASARSIDGCNITELIGTQHENLITFGGHAQAAGFSVAKEKFATVQNNLLQLAAATWDAVNRAPTLRIDCEITSADLTMETIEAIEQMQPFGIANEEPCFILNDITIRTTNYVGKDRKHARLGFATKANPNRLENAIFFNSPPRLPTNVPARIACKLGRNTYNGRTTVDIKAVDIDA